MRRLTCYMFPACDNRQEVGDGNWRRRKARRQPEITSTSSAGPASGASTLRSGRPSGSAVDPSGRPRRWAGPASDSCSPTGSIYERVGNRLWREGESSPVIVHSQTFSGGLRRGRSGDRQQCNGLVGIDDSFRRPHASQPRTQEHSRDWPLLKYEMNTFVRRPPSFFSR